MSGRASGSRGLARIPFARDHRRLVALPGTEEAMSEANLSTQQSQAGQAPRFSPPDVDPRRPGHHQGSPVEGAPPTVGLTWRVDRRDIFISLRQARRHRKGPITISWIPGDPAQPPRVAYTIGRRVGSAVVRNRVRRRLRMLIREVAPQLRSGSYLIGVSPEAALLSYNDLRNLLVKVLKQIEAR
jgi:ribonuclease P protein component